MSHFAKVVNNKVVQVIVAEKEVIDSGIFGDPDFFIQTSYNTRNNIHHGPDGKPDGGVALRGNYAGIGFMYDAMNDVFYPPKPFPSWILNQKTWNWEAPIPKPDDNNLYNWDEETKEWILQPIEIK